MRLSSSRILVTAFCFACSDTTGPGHLGVRYILRDIDGRSLPTLVAIAPALPATVASSGLTFDLLGNAIFTDHRIESGGLNHVVTGRYTYRVQGDSVSFTPQPCPGLLECILIYNITGKIIGQNLTVVLTGTLSDTSITLNYVPN